MDRILFINSCVREKSRTFELAKSVLENLNGKIQEVNLNNEKVEALTKYSLEKREKLIRERDFLDDIFKYARDFASSDVIVVAAPYWDLSFPALLKNYFEQIAVCGITFKYDKGRPVSLCRAKKLIYVTTSGGPIFANLGFEYIKAVAENLFGINDVICFSAEGLDIENADVNKIVENAKKEIYNYFN